MFNSKKSKDKPPSLNDTPMYYETTGSTKKNYGLSDFFLKKFGQLNGGRRKAVDKFKSLYKKVLQKH
jgi:hypothetical protein